MGESKIKLFAFVDETGNTGHNLFDEAQPDFFTAALITKGDFDASFADRTKEIADRLKVPALHGKELGIGRIEPVAADLLALLKAAKTHFFVSRVEKRYLLASKAFDTLFDSGENAAVAWHHYNLRALRLMLVFKFAATIDEDAARLFWQCLMGPNEEAVLKALPGVCEALQRNIAILPDARSRQVLTDGLEWAKQHPESIQIHTDRKIARRGHFPNMVAFTNLLDGLEQHSKRVKRPVARITHDKQGEFQKTLELYHEMFSTASAEEFRWAGETHVYQKVVGSEFDVKEDSASPGIQIADIVLWLYHQFRKKKSLPAGCLTILEYVFENGWESDFSFDGVERTYVEKYGAILSTPITPKQEAMARELTEQAEKNRLESMAQYEKDGQPPFMRSAGNQIQQPE